MTDSSEITASTTHATNIFSTLTSGVGSVPAVDLSADIYTAPTETDNPLYTPPAALTVDELTTGIVGGTGVFDKLMTAIEAHLQKEFAASRITGSDYAAAYVGATQTAMSTAVQFLLGKDQSYHQSLLLQMQARAAEAQAIQAALAVEQTRLAVYASAAEALTRQADYALTKLKLTTEAVQIERLEADVVKMAYETSTLLPAEYDRLVAQKDQVLYQTANILPAQNLGLTKDNAIKDYQLASVLPANVNQITEDTRLKTFQRDYIMPEQLVLLGEQVEAARAQTLDTRRDSTTVVGTIGVQKDLQNEQITSYKRDAEMKYVKMGIDSWMLQKSTDEGITAPTGLNNTNLDALLTSLKTNLAL